MSSRRAPHFYRSMEEFEREELRPWRKAGWSLDDLYSEAKYNAAEDHTYDDPRELDFD